MLKSPINCESISSFYPVHKLVTAQLVQVLVFLGTKRSDKEDSYSSDANPAGLGVVGPSLPLDMGPPGAGEGALYGLLLPGLVPERPAAMGDAFELLGDVFAF